MIFAKAYFSKVFQRNEIKRFIEINFWVAGTTLFKALTQLVTLKMIALHLGAVGIGIFGQAVSCVVALNSIFSSGLLNFTVSEISKNGDRIGELNKICGVIGLWIITAQAVFLFIAVFFARYLSQAIFASPDYSWFFYSLAGVSIFFNLHSASTGFLSALGEIKEIFKAHLASFVAVSLILIFLVRSFLTETAIIASFIVLVSQSVCLVFFLVRTGRVSVKNFWPSYQKDYVIKILKFSIIMIVTGLLGMLYQIYMRNEILKAPLHGWADVGGWQAVLKVSEITMSFLGLSILTSYFPQISKLKSAGEIKDYVSRFALRFGILVVTSLATLILLSGTILHLLYDKSFEGLSSLLRLQLLGDIFKLFGWLFSYFFLAKLRLIFFLSFELISLASLTLLSVLFKNLYGIKGIIYAHCLNSFLFFISGFLLFVIILKQDRKWIE